MPRTKNHETAVPATKTTTTKRARKVHPVAGLRAALKARLKWTAINDRYLALEQQCLDAQNITSTALDALAHVFDTLPRSEPQQGTVICMVALAEGMTEVPALLTRAPNSFAPRSKHGTVGFVRHGDEAEQLVVFVQTGEDCTLTDVQQAWFRAFLPTLRGMPGRKPKAVDHTSPAVLMRNTRALGKRHTTAVQKARDWTGKAEALAADMTTEVAKLGEVLAVADALAPAKTKGDGTLVRINIADGTLGKAQPVEPETGGEHGKLTLGQAGDKLAVFVTVRGGARGLTDRQREYLRDVLLPAVNGTAKP